MQEQHREFFEQITESGETKRGPTVHHNTASYNPTDRCGYHRPADVIEGHGIYGGPYDFDFAIVLDTNNGLIFSFVWNLQD